MKRGESSSPTDHLINSWLEKEIISMTENTRDLSKFGFREIGMAGELLTKYADGRGSWVSELDELADGIGMEFNPNSGNVFLVDEDGRVAMVNDNGKLENWFYCFNCGAEGFRRELPLDVDGNCAECAGK
jgi:hypothetical protein